jgi:TrpR-related protein YerC/YecD
MESVLSRTPPTAPQLPEDLLDVLGSLSEPSDVADLLHDLLTFHEIESLSERWAIVKMLSAGRSQRAVRDAVGASVTTVGRGSKALKYGYGGFEKAFDALVSLGHPDPRKGEDS